MSWRCCAISSARSDSADAVSRRAARRSRTRLFQSGMFDPRNPADDRNEILPALLLGAQRLSALRGQAVVPAPPLVRLLDPSTLDPPLLFHAMQQRVKRRDMKLERPA